MEGQFILINISLILSGRTPLRTNTQIDSFIKQLEEDLKKKEQWAQYEKMEEDQRYLEMLFLLDIHIHERIVHVCFFFS